MRRVQIRGESGHAAIEAALILPALVGLILCAIQIAQIEQARLLTEYAAFNAARAGVVHDGDNGKKGTDGPMRDAAALSVLPGFGRTDGLAALGKAWAEFELADRAFQIAGLPLVQVTVLNPHRADFPRFGQHLDGQELDFDDVRPEVVDATLLSIRVRYLYELRVPFAGRLVHRLWLARRALAGKPEKNGPPDDLPLAALAVAARQGRCFLPVDAFYTMRMQSNPFAKWSAP
jgi:hypothetical protein